MSNFKFVEEDTAEREHVKVHKIASSSKTGCGAIFSDDLQDWIKSNESITCKKNGYCN